MSTAIPVIDLDPALRGGAGARARVAHDIDRACVETGFFTIRGHGVPAGVVQALRDGARAFFELPLEEKLRAQPADPQVPRGYRVLGFDALARGNAVQAPGDLKEYYHFGREGWPDDPYYTGESGRRYFVPNRWPERPAGLAAAAQAYYAEMERLTGDLMALAAIALGVREDFFVDKIDRHITAMRLNFYPALDAPPAPGQMRAGEHTDYGLLTILNGEDVPGGLEVRTRDGHWIRCVTAADTFVVNIGDLLMRWTNDRWLSNVHRVANPPPDAGPGAARTSIAFFHHPNYDARVDCIAPPGEARYPSVLSGEYRDLKYRQTRV